MRGEYLHIVIQPTGSQDWDVGVWLQAVDHALVIPLHVLDNLLGVLVPEEDIATVASTDNILALKTKEIDTLHWSGVGVWAKIEEGERGKN